jgi:hypothetical protein
MRIVLLLSLFAAFAASPLAAQTPRFSISPTVGSASVAPIYDHSVVIESWSWDEGHYSERLTVSAATVLGLRAAYRPGGHWLVYGEVGQGGSRSLYIRRSESGAGFAELEHRTTAAVAVVEAGVGRRIPLGATGSELEVALGGGVHRVRVGEDRLCEFVPVVPGHISCTNWYWVRRYDIPALVGSVGMMQAISGRVHARAGAAYSVGRADTQNFQTKWFGSDEDPLGRPGSRSVTAARVTVGIGIGI